MNGATSVPTSETNDFAGDIEFIRLREVKRITGMGTTYIYEKMKTGDFPGQIKLGPRAVAWIKQEVLAWAVKQVARTRGATLAEHPEQLTRPE
ncbi:helix-turn-helix transcriptional regulator [Pseudomonas putida]|uniref:helix-turn-helix transcriptional regulator n=1 Tax=Pseudomonas shirazica TaxID=1940636 RepID=UPI0035251CA3